MRLEFKDANKEVNLETFESDNVKEVVSVLQVLLQEKVVVKDKLPTAKGIEEPTRTPKPVDNDKMVKSKVYPSLCYVECNRLSTCADAGTDKCQKYAWLNRRERDTAKFRCGHSMNISDFPLDIAEYTCGCCNAHYNISCSVDGEHFTVNCGKCEAPIDLKWNARREVFDNL